MLDRPVLVTGAAGFLGSSPELIYHLAARVDVPHSVDAPEGDGSVNLLGTIACPRSAPPSVLRSSTPLDEAFTAPALLRVYEQLHGLDWTALMIPNAYGPKPATSASQVGVVSRFIGQMLAGKPWTICDGDQMRDVVFVDDVVHAFALAADRAAGQELLIGTGQATSNNRFFRGLAAATAYEHEPLRVPSRPGELRHSCVVARRAGRELGWKPWTTLEEGLAATLTSAAEQAQRAIGADARTRSMGG